MVTLELTVRCVLRVDAAVAAELTKAPESLKFSDDTFGSGELTVVAESGPDARAEEIRVTFVEVQVS